MFAANHAAQAGYTSQLKVGNWSGGAWADDKTGQFSNCGLGLKFSGGSEITVIVPASLNATVIVVDPRLQLTPQQRFQASLKFDQGAVMPAQALALTATMVQIALPAFPNNYDMVRKATRMGVAVPGLSSTLDVSGMQTVMATLYACVVAERGKMNLAPAPQGSDTPMDKAEVFAVSVAVAEKAAVSQYVVLADKDRPPGFEKPVAVWGHLGVPGPDGPSNVLGHSYWYPPNPGHVIDVMRENRKANVRKACADPNVQIVDLPAIPGKAGAAGIGVTCQNAYEEIYIVPRKHGGHFELSFSGPPGKRKTQEPIGVKYRAAIGAAIP